MGFEKKLEIPGDDASPDASDVFILFAEDGVSETTALGLDVKKLLILITLCFFTNDSC